MLQREPEFIFAEKIIEQFTTQRTGGVEAVGGRIMFQQNCTQRLWCGPAWPARAFYTNVIESVTVRRPFNKGLWIVHRWLSCWGF